MDCSESAQDLVHTMVVCRGCIYVQLWLPLLVIDRLPRCFSSAATVRGLFEPMQGDFGH